MEAGSLSSVVGTHQGPMKRQTRDVEWQKRLVRRTALDDPPPFESGSSGDEGRAPGPGGAGGPSRTGSGEPSGSSAAEPTRCGSREYRPRCRGDSERDDWPSAGYRSHRGQLCAAPPPRALETERRARSHGRYGVLEDELQEGDMEWDLEEAAADAMEDYCIPPPKASRWVTKTRSRDGETDEYMEAVRWNHLGSMWRNHDGDATTPRTWTRGPWAWARDIDENPGCPHD